MSHIHNQIHIKLVTDATMLLFAFYSTFTVILATTKPLDRTVGANLPQVFMNKDALLATFIGFIVGLFVTGLVLYGPVLTKNLPKFQFPKISFSLPKFGKEKTTPTPTQEAERNKEHIVTIESPLADSLEQSEKVLISGTTSTSSIVILSGPIDEVVIEANGDGKYAGKVTLGEGKNDITVTSFQKSGASATQSVSVFYTPEEW